MNNLSVSYIYSDVAGIAHQIARLCIGKSAYRIPAGTLLTGGPGQAYAEIRIDTLYETGAIRSLCQAISTVNIRVTQKLQGIVRHCAAHISGCAALIRGCTV